MHITSSITSLFPLLPGLTSGRFASFLSFSFRHYFQDIIRLITVIKYIYSGEKLQCYFLGENILPPSSGFTSVRNKEWPRFEECILVRTRKTCWADKLTFDSMTEDEPYTVSRRGTKGCCAARVGISPRGECRTVDARTRWMRRTDSARITLCLLVTARYTRK
jgi:hypothetical protein